MNIPWLDDDTPLPPADTAKPASSALAGLVAAGGGLSVERLHEAYARGMFPWFSEGQPVLWWSPDPRMVLFIKDFKLHKSLRKTLLKFMENPNCEVRFDSAFEQVIRQCAKSPRKGQAGTWIVEDMVQAYMAFHRAGFAHSVETWVDHQLVGGLYCVGIGDALFGESMFALQTDASKIALAALVAYARTHELAWVDCQQNTKHLSSLGASEMPRKEFLKLVESASSDTPKDWAFASSYWHALLPRKG